MNFRRPLLALSLTLAGTACSSSSNDSSAPGGTDGGSSDSGSAAPDSGTSVSAPVGDSGSPSPDAGPDTGLGTVDSGPIAHAFLRILNASPDGPAIDYCLSAEGNGFIDPVLKTTAGLAYGQASTYDSVISDYYSVRIITAGADCSANLGGTYSFSVSTLAATSYTTLVVDGDLTAAGTDPAFTATAYTDDKQATGTGIALRFVNAASNIASADLGTGTLAASSFAPLVIDAAFGSAGKSASSDAGTADGNSYVQVSALGAVSAHVTGGSSDTVVAASVAAKASEALTVYLIGGKTGSSANPDQLLACKDGASATGTGDCSVVSP